MAPLIGTHSTRSASGRNLTPDSEVVELALLLPRWQALELEQVAHEEGLTAGQMLRRLVGEKLAARHADTATS